MKKILTTLLVLSFSLIFLASCDEASDAITSIVSDALCDDNVVTGTITGSTLSEETEFIGCQSFINVQDTGGFKTILVTIMEGSADGARTVTFTLTPWDDTVTYPVTIDLISTFGACEEGDDVCNHSCGERVEDDVDCDSCDAPETPEAETDGVCIEGCAESATDLLGGDPDCELVDTACIGADECPEGEVCQDDGEGNPECVEDTSGDALIGAVATSILTENSENSAAGEAYGSITIDSLDFSDATLGNISGSLDITYWMEAGYSESLRVNVTTDFDITDDIDSLP
jgi:hypothetical protein